MNKDVSGCPASVESHAVVFIGNMHIISVFKFVKNVMKTEDLHLKSFRFKIM